MPNKHSAGACDCCDFETDCQSLTLINLAKATGIDGMTLRIALPNEDRNFTLDFDAGIPPGPGNATGNPVGLLDFGDIVIEYDDSESAIATDSPPGSPSRFAHFRWDGSTLISGVPTTGDSIYGRLYNTTVETAAISGLQRRHVMSIDCDVRLDLRITYKTQLVFKCIDGNPSWILSVSASQPMGVVIVPPAFAPPTSGPLWNPFIILEDYSSSYWFPDNWRLGGAPFMETRVSPNSNATTSHSFLGNTQLYIGSSGIVGVPPYQAGTFGSGGSTRESTNASSVTLNPEFDPTGLLNFYAELL
jgi:hypothetical protein